jgi:hypothetical protein
MICVMKYSTIMHTVPSNISMLCCTMLYYAVLCRKDNESFLCTFNLFRNFPNLIPSCLAYSPDDRTVEVAQRSDVMSSLFSFIINSLFFSQSFSSLQSSPYSSLEACLNIQLSNLEISVNSINL